VPANTLRSWGFGTVTGAALEAAEILALQGIEAEVINARFAKPLDGRMHTQLREAL
jgi:1-deoxy-D-xylulose-5-phosphate synthase